LLKSAVSGIGHRIHTTKKKHDLLMSIRVHFEIHRKRACRIRCTSVAQLQQSCPQIVSHKRHCMRNCKQSE